MRKVLFVVLVFFVSGGTAQACEVCELLTPEEKARVVRHVDVPVTNVVPDRRLTAWESAFIADADRKTREYLRRSGNDPDGFLKALSEMLRAGVIHVPDCGQYNAGESSRYWGLYQVWTAKKKARMPVLQGSSGERGQKGTQGPQGPPGLQGERGPAGTPGVVPEALPTPAAAAPVGYVIVKEPSPYPTGPIPGPMIQTFPRVGGYSLSANYWRVRSPGTVISQTGGGASQGSMTNTPGAVTNTVGDVAGGAGGQGGVGNTGTVQGGQGGSTGAITNTQGQQQQQQ